MTVALLALSMGACGNKNKAAEPTVGQKADQFVEDIFAAINDNDFDRLESIGNKMGEYINDLTEEQGEEFGEKFATKLYECSDKYGYGEEFADEFLQAMAGAMIEGAEVEPDSDDWDW